MVHDDSTAMALWLPLRKNWAASKSQWSCQRCALHSSGRSTARAQPGGLQRGIAMVAWLTLVVVIDGGKRLLSHGGSESLDKTQEGLTYTLLWNMIHGL